MSKVSVIIPVYNSEKYLEKCLASVIKQTLKDIEIICVNDGSKDNSLSILNEYAAKDKRIKIITQENKGPAEARNTGINSAVSDYIGFVDSDDYIDKKYFELLYKTAVKNKADIAATDRLYITESNKLKKKNCGIGKKAKIITSVSDKGSMIIATGINYNKIYRKDFLKQNNLYHSGFYPGEDNIFNATTIIKSNKIAITHEAKYYYVQHQSSLVHKEKTEKDFNIVKNYEYIENWIQNQKEMSINDKFQWLYIVNKRKNTDFNVFYRDMSKKLKEEFNTLIDKNSKCPKLIVSLTSYPKRIKTVYFTVESLLSQTVKPEHLILWLSEEEFPNKEADLPQNLLDLKLKGMEIEWCKNNIKSYKKLIPAIKKYPDYFIVTTDDDVYYEKHSVEKLLEAYLKNPNCIISNRAHYITFRKNKMNSYNDWIQGADYKKSSFNLFSTGIGGILYFPNCFYKDVLNEDLYSTLCDDTDDIWFWAMEVLNNVKTVTTDFNPDSIRTIAGSQDTSLWYKNCYNGNNDKNLNLILRHYPQIREKLKTGLIKDQIFSVKTNKKTSCYVVTIMNKQFKKKSNKLMLKKIEKLLTEQDEKLLKQNQKIISQEEKLEKIMLMASENNYANIFRDTINDSQWLKNKSLSLSAAAANYSFLYILFRILDDVNPKTILEFGLGQTSKLTTQYVNNKNNDATLDIVDHDEKWIEEFSKKLTLLENTRIYHKNTFNFELNNIESDKYEDLSDITADKKYDLIIIDGPVGYKKTYPRTNILDLIPQNLSEDFVIVLDDAERKGEQNTAKLILKKLAENNIKYEISYKQGAKKQLVITSPNYKFIHWI